MDVHMVIEILLALVAFFGGMFVKGLNDSVKSLHAQDYALTEKIHAMETIVAGEYVKRGEFTQLSEALFRKLDKIETLVHAKADKGAG